jgi:hypothetical protein
LVCTSELNTTQPDTSGKRYHAVFLGRRDASPIPQQTASGKPATADPVEALIAKWPHTHEPLYIEGYQGNRNPPCHPCQLESALRASCTAGDEPWLFAIEEQNKDGIWSWHDGEQCVFGDLQSAKDEVDVLNDDCGSESEVYYRVVPLYRAALAASRQQPAERVSGPTGAGEEK